jgi:hypothetical protein
MAPTEVAINLDMPIHVVQHVKQTWNEIGEVCRDKTAMGRALLMSPEHCKVGYLLFLRSHVSLLIIIY